MTALLTTRSALIPVLRSLDLHYVQMRKVRVEDEYALYRVKIGWQPFYDLEQMKALLAIELANAFNARVTVEVDNDHCERKNRICALYIWLAVAQLPTYTNDENWLVDQEQKTHV